MNNINEKKEKLLNKEITVADLTSNEVNEIKEMIKKDLASKQKELSDLNKKIREIKVQIDNWAN